MRRWLSPLCFLALAACGQAAKPPPQNVIEIEIDDHGLLGLWAANAPNLKGLIARGVFGYSRVQVPTHSNQGNYATLTGQYPDGDDVAGNARLDRPSFTRKVSFQGLGLGDYAIYDMNPLLQRGDSVYRAAERLGIAPAYFGQLPPFEAGASDIHFTIGGATLYGLQVTKDTGDALLSGILGYPDEVVSKIKLDGPGNPGETLAHFTIRDAADFIRSRTPQDPMPRFMYIWDFIAVDQDPTSIFGAEITKVIEDYDDALGELLSALDAQGLTSQTNIVFTLDHGKTDTHNQVVLGTTGATASGPADGQLGQLVAEQGPALGISPSDYVIQNDDGDAVIYANVPNAGSAAGSAEEERVTHALLSLVQSGRLQGVDPTRTITFEGAAGTRRFHDLHEDGPHQADLLLFPLPDWTLNQVDTKNSKPGPFLEHSQYPYGRHGGISTEELYVPVIFAGPAFKEGVLLPHPVNQGDVACTAMWALGAGYLTTAETSPVLAALRGQDGETAPQPTDMTTSQALALQSGGYGGAVKLASGPVQAAVLIDVAGLYYDEIFTDPTPSLRSAAQPFLDMMGQGTVFDHYWTRYRDWPVNEYEMLTGGYPVTLDFIPFAEDDPAQTAAPGFGFLKMPVPQGFVSDPAGLAAWRQPGSFGVPSVFDAAHGVGISTALIGQLDFQDSHLDVSQLDLHEPLDPGSIAGVVSGFLHAHPRALVVVGLGGARTADRHSAAAATELTALGQTVREIASAAAGSLVFVTSRGATTIDDPGADFYGPGTSRHVPLIALGPSVRPGVVTSEPGQGADLPATLLLGLGLPSRTDLLDGTWAAGSAVGGIAQPTPAGATGGHALVRAFSLAGG